jgi:hypothetical protein
LAQELCLYLSISKEEGVCGLRRSASSPDLNRPILKMEKQRGAVNIGIREYKSNGDATVLWVVGKWRNNSRWIYYRWYTKRSCRANDHNAYHSRLSVPNDGGIQPHYHRRIDGFQLPVSFLTRSPYRSNWRWKYHTDAFIATAVKVAIVKSKSVVVNILQCFFYLLWFNEWYKWEVLAKWSLDLICTPLKISLIIVSNG